jgi:PAS domain S-box-containing protein
MPIVSDSFINQFLAGGGEMGNLIRSTNWSKTPIGSPETWPQSLRTAVSIMMDTHFPMYIAWGTEFIQFYNDGYRPILGATKHPQAMGISSKETFAEIWNIIGPMFEGVLRGKAVGFTDFMLPLDRYGFTEECYFIFSYSPIRQENGDVGGVLVTVTETTERVLSERRLKTLRDLADKANEVKSAEHACETTVAILHENRFDVPFSLFYLYDSSSRQYNLIECSSGLKNEKAIVFPQVLEKIQKPKGNNYVEGLFKVNEIANEPIQMVRGKWPEPSEYCYLLPVTRPEQETPFGILVLAVSPRLQFDDKYKSFFRLIGNHAATAIANAYAHAAELKRTQALLEIDKTKTAFFSNISHEFRTPLTLMLGPLEELLHQPQQLNPQQQENIAATHRNAMRLFRLVNTLLDFSRIESGRIQAQYQLVDLASFTQDITSSFRSMIEKAGLVLNVHLQPLKQPTFVDREMWEKIVLNLLSNAFKYTLEGGITVRLNETKGSIILEVTDTGVGIPEKELSHIFERFHRVANASGRTHEGTGIGLSLISELVKLHQGTITVSSIEGQGSTFSVTIPAGHAHLPEGQVSAAADDTYNSVLSDAYIQEAAAIIGNHEFNDPVGLSKNIDKKTTIAITGRAEKKPSVLLVDDNADMRIYVKRLLDPHYSVTTAANGKTALDKINQAAHDLILSDIMMPEMDGVQLLKRIRENPVTAHIPVILLSARAGEEAKIAGYDEGADDYLIKPFAAKELLARVKAQIKISRVRRNTERQLENVFSQAPVAITITKGPTFIIEHANALVLQIWGKTLEQVRHKPVMDALPEIKGQGFFELLTNVYTTGKPSIIEEYPATFFRNGRNENVYLNFNYVPLYELDGSISGVIAIAHEVTELVQAKKSALKNAEELEQEVRKRTHELQAKTEEFKRQKEFMETILDSSVDLIGVYDKETKILAFNKKCEDLYQLKKENVLGKKLEEIMPSALNTKPHRDLQRALKGELVHNEIYESQITGQFLENFLIPLRDSTQQVYGVVAIAHDITDIVVASEKLREANEQLERSNHELEQFAYIASHDLQEPLRKITTFSELLRKGLPESKTESTLYLDKIQQSTARMSTLIKDVLAYSRLSKGNEVFVNTNLMEILEDIKMDFELLIQQKNAFIRCIELPTIQGIPLQLHQLFSNLLSNSLKFSENRPVINITSRYLTSEEIKGANLNPLLSYAEIIFSDNGIGFEQQYAEQIFTIFQRLNSRASYSGTGIGLALCKKIIDNHHGTIAAFSELAKGASFVLRLPTTHV